MGGTLNILVEPSATGSIPAGAIMAFAMPTPPAGWLRCDGREVSRVTYSRLFEAIGTIYGDGDGETTFNLPDIRGQFIRDLDEGKGFDPDRELGSYQDDELKRHKHWDDYSNPHALWHNGANANRYGWISGGWSQQMWLYEAGGDETRPKNIAFIHAIKY